MNGRAETGRRGEDLVSRLLESKGYAIVARNVRVGRLELDIIARKGSLLVVCEVRSRTSTQFGSPAQTVDQKKIAKIRRATAQWLRENRPGTGNLRFDVAAVTFQPNEEPRIDYFERAF